MESLRLGQRLARREAAQHTLFGQASFCLLPGVRSLWQHSTPTCPGVLTFPWATSSLWAAEADLTRALVAAAMDLAASKICSSKSSVSSAC